MVEYERTSRACRPDEIEEPLRSEMVRVATAQAVGDLGTARLCVETHSRRIGSGGLFDRFFGLADPDKEHWTAVVLTRAAVLVGVSGAKRGTRVFFLPLVTLELEERPDAVGIGFKSPTLGGANGPGSYAVYFGSTEVAEAARAALRSALAELRAG